MNRVNAGWIAGMGMLVVSSCHERLVFYHHHGAAGAPEGGAGDDGGTSGRGASAGDAAGGRRAAGGSNGGGTAGDGGADGGSSAQSGSSNSGGSTPSSGGDSGNHGGSNGIPSAAGTNDNGGSPDDAGSGTTGNACPPCLSDQQCVNGTCTCPGTTSACGNACIDYSTSKDNCGGCGNACETYQFCSGGKCLPHYVSTRVQQVTSGGNPASVAAAAVFTDGPQDDLLLQLSGDLVLSAPGAVMTATLSGEGFARYTPDGSLVWSRSIDQLLGGDSSTNLVSTSPVILENGDWAILYYKYDPPPGPVAGTYSMRTGRIGGHTGNLVWEAKFPWSSSNTSFGANVVVPLSATQEIISFAIAYPFTIGGTFCATSDLGTSGAVACPVTQNYMMGAVSGTDGATLWSWGAYDNGGTAALNPWSTQDWQLTVNPFQFSGGDGYLFGSRDDGTTSGPWFTEGDYGVTMKLIVDSAGDLIVAATSSGFVSFNGGQDFLPNGGVVLAKINRLNGHILWKTTISDSVDAYLPEQLVLAPGDRIVTVGRESSDAPYVLSIYSGADGSFLSGFSVASVTDSVAIAAGKTEMYLTGSVSTPADFNPGEATDMLGATPGLFVSRFSFQ